MYFPYLRGRQYELLAIGELIDNNLLPEELEDALSDNAERGIFVSKG